MKEKLKNLAKIALMKTNRLLGREYIPNHKETLYIESTNICNLACVFCAYCKVDKEKLTMSQELFESIVNKATDYGYDDFGLTPIVGEVLFDKDFKKKLEFLENHPKVKSYHFFTNFTLATPEIIDFFVSLKKLSMLSISVYGHDEESYKKLTKAPKKVHDILVDNLNYLHDNFDSLNTELELGIRTYQSFVFDKCDSPLCEVIRKLKNKFNAPLYDTCQYNNWGGLVTDEDVEGLDITIDPGVETSRIGACSIMFYKNLVMADGRINACSTRDAQGSMVFGDLKTQSFEEIFSVKNRAFMDLIENQQKGNVTGVCNRCDKYRSIYRYHKVYRYHKKPPISLKDFYKQMGS